MLQSKVINHSELTFGKKLGNGGFGVVYQGSFRHNDVAIKQLLMDKISKESEEEFIKESQMMAGLGSPNIVQFFGFCNTPVYCIVMEYMPNGSLFGALRRTEPLEWSVRLSIALDMAKGVAFLHQENILHRDIKSLNVLLDEHYKAKLTDFGLSKVKSETKSHTMATKTGSKDSVGTIAWMAPELFKMKPNFTQKSDIYSLGITFWELASRQIPFSSVASQELIPGFVKDGERDDIPTDCPAHLAKVIQQCWDGAAEKRPDADTVVVTLKKASVSLPADSLKVNPVAGPASGPRYADNFASEVPASPKAVVFPPPPPVQKAPVPAPQKPVVFSPQAPAAAAPKAAIPAPLTAVYSPQAAPVPAPGKSAPQVDASLLKTFLQNVVEGEQGKAETMLKQNKDVALVPGDVTDLSGRKFQGITGFQYALWALDWHMWSMIKKYMPEDDIKAQVAGYDSGPWIKQHGVSVNWQNLVLALNNQIELLQAAKWAEAQTQWQQTVGGAQRLVPAHVVNEYCHPSRSFNPCPDFEQGTELPRTRNTDEGDWYTASYNGGKLGEKFAVCRGALGKVQAYRWTDNIGRVWGDGMGVIYTYVTQDREACRALLATRTQQRDQLLAQYAPEKKVVAGAKPR